MGINTVVETFFATLKRELVYRRSWPTRDEATATIHARIENFYSREGVTRFSVITQWHTVLRGTEDSSFPSRRG